MKLDRKIAPKLHVLDNIKYLEPKVKNIKNTTFYTFVIPGSEVVQMDFVFKSGFLKQGQPLLANYAYNQVLSGTEKLTSTQINNALDSLGAYSSMKVEQNHSVLTIYCIEKNLKGVLAIVLPVIEEVNYPQDELDIYKNSILNSYKINKTKTSYNSRVAINGLLYGENTALGYALQEKDYHAVSRGTIQKYHSEHISIANCFIVLSSGNENIVDTISHFFERELPATKELEHKLDYSSSTEMYKLVQVDNAVQSAVNVSKIMVEPGHPDFHKISFVNTLLGGYFGSRLMSNIREEKGLTYGIHSSVTINGDKGVFTISTEVKGDKHQECLIEIEKEINKLRIALVSTKEMDTVKNYTLGLITKNVSDPTNHSNRLINILSKGLDYNHLYEFIKTVNEITPEDVLEISNTYFEPSTFYKVVATNTN